MKKNLGNTKHISLLAGIVLFLAAVIIELLILVKLYEKPAVTPLKSPPNLSLELKTKIAVENKSSMLAEKARLEKLVDILGAEDAYREFKAEYLGEDYGAQHTAAHIFGEVLYEKKGLKGVSVCDKEFAFGCYHSFFGVAVNKEGIGILPILDKACIAKWTIKGIGCQHGIGHGVLSYFGDAKLLDALEACTQLSWKGPIGGCTSGVFMEYNFHTMLNPSRITLRPLDQTDPHLPCSMLPEKFSKACYFEQPDWWDKVYSHDYLKIGELCQQITETSSMHTCFRGFGNVVGVSTDYNPDEAIDICRKMPTEESENLCRQGASWSFYSNDKTRHLAHLLCKGLKKEEEDLCIKSAEII